MHLGPCQRLIVPVLCVLLCLPAPAAAASAAAVPAAAHPASAASAVAGDTSSDGPAIGAEVARLYEQAARASATYEQGRCEAKKQRARALRLERLIARERHEIQMLRANVGRVARAQYRAGGGGIAYTAKLLLADDPQELMDGHRLAWQAELAVSRMLDRAQRAERRLIEDEQLATTAWLDLEARTQQLATIKRTVTAKLEDARWKLQGTADRSVAAGRCAGAVRPDEQAAPSTRPWVTPVEDYELSAGFGGEGARWKSRHTGQDFAVDIGTPVRAIGAGRVVSVACGGGFGIEVVVGHPDGYYSQYAHLAGVMVDQGERVRTGQWIGQAGTTGNSSGPHLHFEVRLTPHLGSGIDPAPWMRERGAGF
ncbi:peptidase M23 [Streptomyces agglomeratus]|uniref:M23 family metallopeptidase n=1 Tax=Streptomyces agglomeratus TaxID=285458 RepID=UPI000854F169|nr:M23 family metallopeptidase [Streptomyces agglomeratus]OEJ39865.1 peptidase M23 [Streptomyces agglomeratus]OEJ45756.1 peptidase M23 [Streptomyces agglomeratus]